MIPWHVIWTLRGRAIAWRQLSALNIAIKPQYFTTHAYGGPPKTMDEILKRTVGPLPTYETKDKSPLPPESNSVEFMHFYRSLDKEQTLEFLDKLSLDFGVDHRNVLELAGKLLETQTRDLATVLQAEDRLRYSLMPRYRQLLSHISRVEGGVKFLVDLRADLIEIISSKASDSPHIRVNILIRSCSTEAACGHTRFGDLIKTGGNQLFSISNDYCNKTVALLIILRNSI